MAQVIARPVRNFPPLVPIHRSYRGLHIVRCPGLNFDETNHISVPSDRIDLSTILWRPMIPSYDCVADLPQIEEGILLSAYAYAKMRWQSRGR